MGGSGVGRKGVDCAWWCVYTHSILVLISTHCKYENKDPVLEACVVVGSLLLPGLMRQRCVVLHCCCSPLLVLEARLVCAVARVCQLSCAAARVCRPDAVALFHLLAGRGVSSAVSVACG